VALNLTTRDGTGMYWWKVRGREEPVPVKLIERIARFRAKEAAQREKSKLAALRRCTSSARLNRGSACVYLAS